MNWLSPAGRQRIKELYNAVKRETDAGGEDTLDDAEAFNAFAAEMIEALPKILAVFDNLTEAARKCEPHISQRTEKSWAAARELRVALEFAWGMEAIEDGD